MYQYCFTCQQVNMLKNLKCTYFTNDTVYKKNIARGNRQIIKLGGKTITIYGHSQQMLNITGIKSWSDMKTTKMLIEKEYQVKVLYVRIDCAFFSHKGRINIDLNKIYYHVRDNLRENYFVDYNVELYPGMYIKRDGYPTINLFRTGSYQIVGGKSIEKIMECKLFVKNLISEYRK